VFIFNTMYVTSSDKQEFVLYLFDYGYKFFLYFLKY